MTVTNLTAMLKRQLELQRKSFGVDPLLLEGEERMEFIRWNLLALFDELHEAMQEVGWKPWASSEHVRANEFMNEMVDAWHFFMNLLLVVNGRHYDSDMQLAEDFVERYFVKADVNAARQASGYDGVAGKCPVCRRDLAESECTEEVCSGV